MLAWMQYLVFVVSDHIPCLFVRKDEKNSCAKYFATRDTLFKRSKTILCNFISITAFLPFSCLVFIITVMLYEYLWYMIDDKKKSEQSNHLTPIFFTFFVRIGWIVPFPITLHVCSHLSPPCMKYCGFYMQAGIFHWWNWILTENTYF